jgi:hypothetical protein
MTEHQSASAMMMVRPDSFGFDEQTAATNVFQHKPNKSQTLIQAEANHEFEALAKILREEGVEVFIPENDQSDAVKPNAVFPNNWLSMWPDGTIYLYPMATESRRTERSPEIIKQLRDAYAVSRVIDFSPDETYRKYLESTGTMIFDHLHRNVYGCLSLRCNEDLFRMHADELGYNPIVFHATDRQGRPIYHTNVMLAIQSTTAIVCSTVVEDPQEKSNLLQLLEQSGRDIIDITPHQMASYCANVLEVRNKNDEKILVMSNRAYDAFTPEQLERLTIDKKILKTDVSTIEDIGGGGLRCMLAEIFLPQKQ